MSQGVVSIQKGWTREEVEKALKEILVDALGVEEEKVVPEASLVHDLGAESIDFLDIGFRVQQTFGVELPNRAIQEKALSWRNMAGLSRVIEERYRVGVSPEEMRQLHTMGIPGVLRWLAEKRGIGIQNGDAEKIAAELADRLVSEVESVGFQGSLIDRGEVMQQMLQNINSPKIMEGMIRLFSMGALVDFIAAKVGDKTA
ncbi:MAG: acyl carrier protein [Deltaproteobacteria bacterium]|nr:acyl carrier protein [Deltaproteobacteria bacterium]